MTECICPTHYHKDKDGYPRVKYNHRTIPVTRLMFTLMYGPLGKDVQICHTCDNPSCVNPNHLYLGNHKTNTQDKVDRKRVVGANNPNAKFTDKDLENMYFMYHTLSYTQKELSIKYDTSQSTISAALKRYEKLLNDEQTGTY